MTLAANIPETETEVLLRLFPLERLVAFDLETYLITPNCPAPRMVCGSVSRRLPNGEYDSHLLYPREEVFQVFEALLDSDLIIVCAQAVFDLGVMAMENPAYLPGILRKLRNNEVFDILRAQELDAIAYGHLGKNPDHSPLRKPSNGEVTNRYSLDLVIQQLFGRNDAKANDKWRLRYAELDCVPLELWDHEAKQYPVDDAQNQLQAAIAQLTGQGKTGNGSHPGIHRNLEDLSEQCRAHFGEHLAYIEGLHVDLPEVDKYETEVMEIRVKGQAKAAEAGLLRLKGTKKELAEGTAKLSKDTKEIKRRILISAGGWECDNHEKPDPDMPEKEQKKFFKARKKLDDACESCLGTGIVVPAGIQLTDGGDISMAREVLEDQDDPDLKALADVGKSDKAVTTYIPYLRSAYPTIHPHPNVMLVTGRSSYDGAMQQMPRKGRERSCIIADPGKQIVSADFCFVAGTLVDTPTGDIPIEQLTLGQPVFSYRFDRRRPVVGQVTQLIRVGMAPIVKVTLDNGQQVRCTPQHKWMRCPQAQNNDPEYVKAGDLKPGDRLLPLRKVFGGGGYQHLYAHKAVEYSKTHIVVAEAMLGPRPKGHHVHHKNEIKLDNSPENLEYVSRDRHLLHHVDHLHTALQDPEVRKRLSNGIKQALVNRGGHHGKNNPRWGDKRAQKETACGRCGKLFWHRGERLYCSRQCYVPEGKFTRPCALCKTPFTDFACHADRQHCSDLCARQSRKGKFLTPERKCLFCDSLFRGSARRKFCSSTCANRCNAIGLNHKVVSVEPDGFDEVWSIEVSPDHNYALSAGVFVGNSGIECVTWSQASQWLLGYSTMGDAILAGIDIHADMASKIMDGRMSWQEIKKLAKIDPSSEAGLMRQVSKPANFGLPGGMGALTFVLAQKNQGVILCRFFGHTSCKRIVVKNRKGEDQPVCDYCYTVAQELRRQWLEKWEEAKPYFKRVSEIIDATGEVPTLVPDEIRRGGVLRMRGGVEFSDACNNFFQSLAAAGAKAALWRLTEECWGFENEALLGSSVRFFMHDEFLLVSPEEKAEEAGREMSRIMIEEMQRYVPDVAAGVKVEHKISKRWVK